MAQYLLCIWVKPFDFQWPHFLNSWLVAILNFSVSGRHGFGSVTQVCFWISVSNFMCMSFVAVGRSLTIVSYVAFKMAALWFWTMFHCNPPIAHCHPLLWSGGILVDYWSTISSWPSPHGIFWPQHQHGDCPFLLSELNIPSKMQKRYQNNFVIYLLMIISTFSL